MGKNRSACELSILGYNVLWIVIVKVAQIDRKRSSYRKLSTFTELLIFFKNYKKMFQMIEIKKVFLKNRVIFSLHNLSLVLVFCSHVDELIESNW